MTHPLTVVPVLPGPFGAQSCADTIGEVLVGQRLVTDWLAPDVTSINQVVTDVALLIQYIVEYGGTADMLDDRSGAALWYPVTTGGRPLPLTAALRRSTVDDAYAARWAALEDVVHSVAPAGSSCHLLVLLTVAADRGRIPVDRTAALLQTHHAVLDSNGITARTAAFTRETRSLLAHHGWTAGTSGRLAGGWPWWPLWRPPTSVDNETRSTR